MRPFEYVKRTFGGEIGPAPSASELPLTMDEVLREEAEAIHHADLSGKAGTDLHRALNELNSAALCLSGGGIRSSSFGLGIIQALAVHPRSSDGRVVDSADNCLLARFHYLSTVSGGGYIGSWLSAWRARAPFEAIWRNLVGRPDGSDVEPASIAWLRSYSNYLTPKLGAASADAWAIIAVYLRNLLLNWLIIISGLCVGILAAKVLVVALVGLVRVGLALELLGVAGICCLMIALRFNTRQRPSRHDEAARRAGVLGECSDQTFFNGCLAWSLGSALLLAQYLDMQIVARGPSLTAADLHFGWIICAVAGAVIYGASWIIAWPGKREFLDWMAWTTSGLVFGVLVGLGFFWLFYYHLHLYPQNAAGVSPVILIVSKAVAPLIIGVPWILVSQFFAQMVFVGLTSYRQNFNADQEWFGRASGWMLIIAAVWELGMFVVFAHSLVGYGNRPITAEIYRFMAYWAVPVTGVAGLVVALLGTSNVVRFDFGLKGVVSILADALAALAAALFIGALVFTLSAALDQILLRVSPVDPSFDNMIGRLDRIPPDYSAWSITLAYLAGGLAFSVLVTATASRLININRFSLHEIYRNRLTRAFLGASRRRHPDPFTGFDEGDDVPMHALWPRRPVAGEPPDVGGWRPFHLINLTLNIVSADRLAWQERKAAPFTVSPLHCGTSSKSYLPAGDCGYGGGRAKGAYRRARSMAGRTACRSAPRWRFPELPPIRTWAGHSSPAVTFLMTVFNLRLGWWLGNPGPEGAVSYRHDGPAVAIHPLLQETLGLTTDSRPYVNLSDGGHFDNLGLYEMVRRRCRFILIADAGCDPTYAFADLGNAVRKIAIDLGVPIRFGRLEVLKRRPLDGSDLGPDVNYHAIGEIDYQAADDSRDSRNGVILYVKAGYRGTESADVRSYAMANPDFPHQSTMNQWFSESQFESYRSLGFEIMNGLLKQMLAHEQFGRDATLDNLAVALQTMSAPGPDNVLAFQQMEQPPRPDGEPANRHAVTQ